MMKKQSYLFAMILVSLPISAHAQTAGAPPNTSTKHDDTIPMPKEDRHERMRGAGNGQFKGVAGTITEIKGETLIIKMLDDGKSATVTTNASTRFMKDRQEAKLADFKTGDMVMVRGESASEGNWTASFVGSQADMASRMGQMKEDLGKKFIAGEVKSIDLDNLKLTILRIDGQTQVISVDENTSFKKQGESITLADIKAGDRVMGQGQLKDNLFVPTVLRVGNFPQMQIQQPKTDSK